MASNQEHVFVNLTNQPQATLTEMSAFLQNHTEGDWARQEMHSYSGYFHSWV